MGTNDDNFRERYPADSPTSFLGSITASVTHELNNILSIISQTGGLLEDFLYGAKSGQELSVEELNQIAAKIAAQSERGISTIRRLNKFVHSADFPVAAFDVYETLENIGSLMQRIASLRKVTIKIESRSEKIEATGPVLEIQRTIFLAVKELLAVATKDDTISISAEKSDSGLLINMHLVTKQRSGCPELSQVSEAANAMPAKVKMEIKPDGVYIVLSLPPNYNVT